MKKAIYPGSFDPITNGHMDILKRASQLFDHVTMLLAVNPNKKSEFTVEERLQMMKEATKDIENVGVDFTSGLTVEYARKVGAKHIIRGLRAVTDFEYEFQMALMNRGLNEKCETLFMMPSPEYSYVSSRLIKEIAKCGGDVSSFVPPVVAEAMSRKFGRIP